MKPLGLFPDCLSVRGQRNKVSEQEAIGAGGQQARLWVPGWLSARSAGWAAALVAARTDLVLWAPIAMGLGIGGYFLWPAEPGRAVVLVVLLLGLAGFAGWIFAPEAGRFPSALLVLVCFGALLAVGRAHAVAAPVLSFRYYGPVEGRVTGVDRSARDKLRITLDQVVLSGVAAQKTPARVRLTLGPGPPPEPGFRVMTTGHLQPPPGPAEPGGWDFRRAAWFARLGAVGSAQAPVLVVEPPVPGDWTLAGDRLRRSLSQAMQARMEGQAGAVAAALMTGDRSGIAAATNDAMRASGLYHIVSISGLHMGMLAGFVFAAIRYGLALAGPLALYWPTKKIAAVAALIAATVYLWIAGPEVATQRAYIMTAVMLAAVLFDRRALSLHTVALAAIAVLVLRPESLTEPGFQMSFAATVGLIVMLGPWARWAQRLPARLRPVLAPVLGLALTSVVAGLATGPVAAAQFGRISGYGLIANMLAVPVMGVAVMPAGVIAAVLAPFGLAAPALWVMEMGTRWMIFVAEHVAALDGAQGYVVQPGPAVLPLMAAGAAIAVVGRGAVRLAGVAAVALATGLWLSVPRPALLIAPEGQAVGLMTPAGRALSKPGAEFAVAEWLQADGDGAAPAEAFARTGFEGARGERTALWNGRPVVHLSGKAGPGAALSACHDGAIVILAGTAPEAVRKGMCTLWDLPRLSRSGAVAYDAGGQVRVADGPGHLRLWSGENTRFRGAP